MCSWRKREWRNVAVATDPLIIVHRSCPCYGRSFCSVFPLLLAHLYIPSPRPHVRVCLLCVYPRDCLLEASKHGRSALGRLVVKECTYLGNAGPCEVGTLLDVRTVLGFG